MSSRSNCGVNIMINVNLFLKVLIICVSVAVHSVLAVLVPEEGVQCVLCCTSAGHRGNEVVSCSVGQTLPFHCVTHQLCIHPLTPASLLVKLPRGQGRSPVATTGQCPLSQPISGRRREKTTNRSRESRSSSAPVGSHQKF